MQLPDGTRRLIEAGPTSDVATHTIRRYEIRVLYRFLKQLLQVTAARRACAAPPLTQEQRVDWAYGTAVIENPAVTRAMVEAAAQAR